MSGLGKQRWVVERGFAWLRVFTRLRTRCERRADIHLGLMQLACALICYRRLRSFRNELLRMLTADERNGVAEIYRTMVILAGYVPPAPPGLAVSDRAT